VPERSTNSLLSPEKSCDPIILEIDTIQKIESKKMESKTGLIVTFRVCKDKVNLSG
jgi:hypothetical protein